MIGRVALVIGCSLSRIWIAVLLFGLLWFSTGPADVMLLAFLTACVPALLGGAIYLALRKKLTGLNYIIASDGDRTATDEHHFVVSRGRGMLGQHYAAGRIRRVGLELKPD